MDLLDRLRKDSRKILNSKTFGFSQDAVLTDPDGVEHDIKAIISVIHNLVDPDTGQPVSGFLATASINRLDLLEKQLKIPFGEMRECNKPYVITITDIDGKSVRYKITRSAPDEANGNILCDLGGYDEC